MTTLSPPFQEELSLSDFLRCRLISREPLIILSYGLPMGVPIQLSPFLADRRVYFLMGNWWTLLDPKGLAQTKALYDALSDRYPQHRFLFLTNAREECQALDRLGMPNFFCHHNAFLDERIFCPQPGIKKTLDAVYTARLNRFKRHILARHIPAWGLLYYHDQTNAAAQSAYLEYLRRVMPAMDCLNHDPATGAYRRLDPSEMCRAYNRARVGLCLSQAEGGNYATTEYLLCGLPVVSTPSTGGRDFFLDPETSRIVEPDARAVAGAVAELIARRLPPREVRLRALLRMREHRQGFIGLIESILAREGCPEPFADRFEKLFTNKMLDYPGTPEKFLSANGLLPGPAKGR
jgi:hypothetical protein